MDSRLKLKRTKAKIKNRLQLKDCMYFKLYTHIFKYTRSEELNNIFDFSGALLLFKSPFEKRKINDECFLETLIVMVLQEVLTMLNRNP